MNFGELQFQFDEAGRRLRIPVIETGGAACGIAHLNCRGVGHDGSGLTSFLLDLGF